MENQNHPSLQRLAQIVAQWADSTPNVKLAYLFGSRVKGTNSSLSDLDVAIALDGDDEGFANWVCDASEMRAELGSLLPVALDLQMMHSSDHIVMPAVLDHGLLVYESLRP